MGAPDLEIAARIAAAFASGVLIEPPGAADPSLDEARAYAIAADLHARRLALGERPVGRKIGFTNRSLWGEFGVRAPIWGRVYDTTLVRFEAGGGAFDSSRLLWPRLEPEVVLHLAQAPAAGLVPDDLLACVDWIALGFELVQCPYPEWRFSGVDAIAAGGLHGALVVGSAVAVAEIESCAARLRTFTAQLAGDDAEPLSGRGSDVLGSPLAALARLVELTAGTADALRGGELVTTGTLVAPPFVAAGDRYEVTVDGLPLPPLRIELAAR